DSEEAVAAGCSVACTATLERLDPRLGSVQHSRRITGCQLTLQRDSHGELRLRLAAKTHSANLSAKGVVIFKKFWREGKCTLRLPSESAQLLLSNCPVDRLADFLKLLFVKQQCAASRQQRAAPLRQLQQHRQPALPQAETDISPVSAADLAAVRARQAAAAAAAAGSAASTATTPQRLQRKRPAVAPAASAAATAAMLQLPGFRPAGGTPPSLKGPRLDLLSSPLSAPGQHALTEEQAAVLDAVRSGVSVFYTGSAGTGKSVLLQRIVGMLPPDRTVVSASTGVAACQIGGQTLHSFAGVGDGSGGIERCVSRAASRPAVAEAWRRCRHLVIDEISMVDAEFFDCLDVVARTLRRSREPFGGIQLVLCGDFLQLPPVKPSDAKGRRFAFESSAWQRAVKATLQLRQVHRQADRKFVDLLTHIRYGRCEPRHSEMLRSTRRNLDESSANSDKDIVATQLCTHKRQVEAINQHQLRLLPTESVNFVAKDSMPAGLNSLLPSVPEKIELKIGAQRGSGPGWPVVRFVGGHERIVDQHEFAARVAGAEMPVIRRQVPLQLAWAISVHKSQGMTLDACRLYVSEAFEAGQVYVALSRCRSLESLSVANWDASCVRADERVLNFYRQLRECSG
uniref:ATP-dependent DNA helicase n=1 Tax=Macrostomum lignano TaxID=282301 RepID=A0A1I8GGV2_9PLAT